MMRKLLLFAFLLISISKVTAQTNLEINPCLAPFYHGVASGDPLSDRVIIWTRVTPANLGTGSVNVSWKIATDTTMTSIINSGTFVTDQNRDYTVKVDVTGLSANQYYYYQFEASNMKSAIGRTKTAPLVNQGSSRFGVVSCANLEAGFFNVYKVMNLRNDMDAVLCLGDYIYEYEEGGYSPNPAANRHWEPATETTTLSDYRTRYSTYHMDADLRRNHQLFPWVCIWDDHESANDSWKNGAENHNTGEGNWADRENYAKQAYFEWMPIRETGTTDPYQIYRSIPYGNNIDLVMLDTRLHGRDQQAGTSGTVVNSTTRELLGADQRIWMTDNLSQSTAQWKVVAQQVMMAPLSVLGVVINEDQWNGYPAERDRFFNFISTNNIKNVVVLTGDIHSSWASDLPKSGYNASTGANSVGVEFVAPSVTSLGTNIPGGPSLVKSFNSHIKYIDFTKHGFVLLDINQQRAQADWFYVSTIDNSSAAYTHGASWLTNNQANHIVSSATPSVAAPFYSTIIAPSVCPVNTVLATTDFSSPKVLSLYPNPSSDFFTIQYTVQDTGNIEVQIIDNTGRIVKKYSSQKHEGIWTERYPTDYLAAGDYYVKIVSQNYSTTQKLIIAR